jgi:hypothetical protein
VKKATRVLSSSPGKVTACFLCSFGGKSNNLIKNLRGEERSWVKGALKSGRKSRMKKVDKDLF